MIGADIAKDVLTKIQNNVAQSAIVEKYASAALVRFETGGLTVVYTLTKSFAEFTGNVFVQIQRILVNVDLPADTAAVAAFVRNTAEAVVVIGFYELHVIP